MERELAARGQVIIDPGGGVRPNRRETLERNGKH